MTLIKSDVFDLLAKHLCFLEVDLTTYKFTYASLPLETLLGYDVPGDLVGKLVEAVLPGLLTPAFVAAPTPQTVAVSGVSKDGAPLELSVLIVPRATETAEGRVVWGVVSCSPPVALVAPSSPDAKGTVP